MRGYSREHACNGHTHCVKRLEHALERDIWEMARRVPRESNGESGVPLEGGLSAQRAWGGLLEGENLERVRSVLEERSERSES